MKLTENQIQGMLNHADTPYIRGIGFLYLRFSIPPEQLFSWFCDYFNDEEEIYLRQKTGPTSMGAFVKLLLTEQRFCDIIIPRIPVPIQRDIDKNLSKLFPAKKPEKEKKEASPPVKKRSRSKSPKQNRSKSPKKKVLNLLKDVLIHQEDILDHQKDVQDHQEDILGHQRDVLDHQKDVLDHQDVHQKKKKNVPNHLIIFPLK